MKLLVTSPSSERGGVEEYALTVATAAVQAGWSVHAAFPAAAETVSLVRDFSLAGVSYHPQIQYPVGETAWDKLRQNGRRLKQAIALLQTVNPDCLLINLPLPVQSLDLMLASALLHIPAVVIFHSFPERLTLPPFKLKLYQWIQSRHQRWIGVSNYNCQRVCQSFGLPRPQVQCIYNGVKLPPTLERDNPAARNVLRNRVRQELGLPPNALILLTVGRLDLEKGYGDLAAVAPTLLADFPEAHFLWAGEGIHRQELIEQVQQIGLSDRIFFLGHRNDIPDLLLAADLFVFPTHYEGMPFALLEAMAHGLPIVSSDVCGIPEIIEHQRQGLLFPGGDLTALLTTLQWALCYLDRMVPLAQRARERVEGFSETVMLQKVLIVLQALPYTHKLNVLEFISS